MKFFIRSIIDSEELPFVYKNAIVGYMGTFPTLPQWENLISNQITIFETSLDNAIVNAEEICSTREVCAIIDEMDFCHAMVFGEEKIPYGVTPKWNVNHSKSPNIYTQTFPNTINMEEVTKIILDIKSPVKNNMIVVCPDCKGTGKYTGFIKIESCKKCGGAGNLS